MFQPLDYMFEVMIAIWCIYAIFLFHRTYLRVNRNVKDDLIERYIELQRIYESRR